MKCQNAVFLGLCLELHKLLRTYLMGIKYIAISVYGKKRKEYKGERRRKKGIRIISKISEE